MRIIKTLFIIILFFITVYFSLQNTEEVTVHLFGPLKDITAPTFSVILASVFLGILIGIISSGLRCIGLLLQLNKQKKELEALRKEIASYKGEAGSKE